MMEYLKLLRVKHYIKNFLIFIPLFFSGYLYDLKKIHYCFIGFLCFCFVSSSIYILNDIKDLEKDKKHPTKCNRPLASGKIKISTGIIMLVASLIISIGLSIYLLNLYAGIILSVYFICNLLYSLKLKNVPIVDIAILTSGFILRVFYGGALIDVSISSWLFLVIMSGSLFMVFGKRRNEFKKQIETREVLKYYNEAFLDKFMYVCLAITIVFYSLWTIGIDTKWLPYTIPFLILILMCYSLDCEGDSDGDPVEVIFHDKKLIALSVLYVLTMFFLIYWVI